jgi:hypothetical protein
MKALPITENALVLRTDFSDDAAWQRVCAAIGEPVGDFRAYVEFLSDPDFEGVTADQLVSVHSADYPHVFAFLIDRITLNKPEHPILVVDLLERPGRTFRVVPSQSWVVENNLSIANADFSDLAAAADPDGILRGFPDDPKMFRALGSP